MQPHEPDVDALLDNAIREHYALLTPPQTLTKIVLDEKKKNSWLPLWGVGAVALAATLVFVLMPSAGLDVDIAHEVWAQEQKREPMTFHGATFAALSRQMARLDFPLLASRYIDADMRIRGAKYCSVAGALAARVSLADTANNHHTLYVTHSEPRFVALGDKRVCVDAGCVKLWTESGLLYVMTLRDTSPQ